MVEQGCGMRTPAKRTRSVVDFGLCPVSRPVHQATIQLALPSARQEKELERVQAQAQGQEGEEGAAIQGES